MSLDLLKDDLIDQFEAAISGADIGLPVVNPAMVLAGFLKNAYEQRMDLMRPGHGSG